MSSVLSCVVSCIFVQPGVFPCVSAADGFLSRPFSGILIIQLTGTYFFSRNNRGISLNTERTEVVT